MKHKGPQKDVTIFTIGHSNHSLEAFLALVERHRIELVVDVRSSPYAGYATQFNREPIRNELESRSVEYLFLGAMLGGRPQGDEFYDRESHVLYDRLAESRQFQKGIQRLLDRAQGRRAALMCGEEDPTDCHRRLLIGRVLRELGWHVLHIRGDGRLESEDELSERQRFQKTKGQLTLFDMEEAEPWRSTRSVSPRKPRPSSSQASDEPA